MTLYEVKTSVVAQLNDQAMLRVQVENQDDLPETGPARRGFRLVIVSDISRPRRAKHQKQTESNWALAWESVLSTTQPSCHEGRSSKPAL